MTGWQSALKSTWQDPFFATLLKRVKKARARATVFPPEADVFKALTLTPFEAVKVVILGQDPYHGENQAMGLAFSVQKGVKIPPSLMNIYKELQSDLGINRPLHGDLSAWAKQGVLLLNTTLTVEAAKPMSHKNIGWEWFTDRCIEALNKKTTPVVFILWGAHARQKRALITNPKHHILEAPHPSPLSASRGFFGCKHFSKANAILKTEGLSPIDFAL